MSQKAYVLKELESGRYRCQNAFVSDEEYHKNIINACIYEYLDAAEYQRDSLNRAANTEFVKVVTITISTEE